MAATGHDHKKIFLASSPSTLFDIHLTLSSLRKLISGSACDPYQIKDEPDDDGHPTILPSSSAPPQEEDRGSICMTTFSDVTAAATTTKVVTNNMVKSSSSSDSVTSSTTLSDSMSSWAEEPEDNYSSSTTTPTTCDPTSTSDNHSSPVAPEGLQDETTTTAARKSSRAPTTALEEQPPSTPITRMEVHRLDRWMSPTKSPLVYSTDHAKHQEEHIQTASWDVPNELFVHLSTDVGLKLSFLAPEELREPPAAASTSTPLSLDDGRNQLRRMSTDDWPSHECHRRQDPHELITLNNTTKQQQLPAAGFHQSN
jgi:hypothetical protein